MKRALPADFKQLFWSENFENLELEKDKKKIIVNLINYGDLDHWRWLVKSYGQAEVRDLLSSITVTELRERVRPLAKILFKVESFNYAPRSLKA